MCRAVNVIFTSRRDDPLAGGRTVFRVAQPAKGRGGGPQQRFGLLAQLHFEGRDRYRRGLRRYDYARLLNWLWPPSERGLKSIA